MNQALVFVSIILGVAISDQILSLHRLLRSEAPIKWHWAQPWFALLVLQLNVMIWWGMAGHEGGQVTIGAFLPALVMLILLALLTVSTLPDKIPEKGLDLAAYYRSNARYQWLLLSAATAWAFIVDLARVVYHGNDPLILVADRAVDLSVLAIMIAMAFIRRWWLVAIGLALLMAGPANWLSRSVS